MNQAKHLLLGDWLAVRLGLTSIYQIQANGFSILPTGLASVFLSISTAEVRFTSLDCAKLLNCCVSLGKACLFLYRSLLGN